MKRYSVKQPTTYRMVIHCLVLISRVLESSRPYFPRMRMRVGKFQFRTRMRIRGKHTAGSRDCVRTLQERIIKNCNGCDGTVH